MATLDDKAGGQDGYWAKLLHADAPSGRQGGWEILQLYADALYPAGLRVGMMPALLGLTLPKPANENRQAEQLPLDLDVAGPHRTLKSWHKRRRPPRVYRIGGKRRA